VNTKIKTKTTQKQHKNNTKQQTSEQLPLPILSSIYLPQSSIKRNEAESLAFDQISTRQTAAYNIQHTTPTQQKTIL